MKKTFLILVILLSIGFSSFAQSAQDSVTNTVKAPKKYESESKDRIFFVLNHDNLFHKQKEVNGFETQWYSRGYGIYFMYDFQINKSKFSLAPGIGYNHASYYHNAELVEDSLGVSFPVIHDLKTDKVFKRARMALHYLDFPVELRYRHKFNNGRSLKLALGLKGSLKLASAIEEVKIGVRGYAKHHKTKNFKDFNTWRLGSTFRAGYGPVNLLLYYNFLPLFKKNQGPKMTPFSIGIAITSM